ncbi:uncharacterized protein ARMOST_06235 [Armillaria ostoyae]|uniref:Uncharacterized protein n=1 Tax=Armillaria ostoyae TaxID=47428 RepID=A0A284R2D6_ARMOS|nr:uncharacterized protein ARMOST_06235 [Armillaria ostoyae]
MPSTLRNTITVDGVGLPKSAFRKKDQRDANEVAIQVIVHDLAPPKPGAQSCPCQLGGTCYGFMNLYTGQSAGVFSLDDLRAVRFAHWQQRCIHGRGKWQKFLSPPVPWHLLNNHPELKDKLHVQSLVQVIHRAKTTKNTSSSHPPTSSPPRSLPMPGCSNLSTGLLCLKPSNTKPQSVLPSSSAWSSPIQSQSNSGTLILSQSLKNRNVHLCPFPDIPPLDFNAGDSSDDEEIIVLEDSTPPSVERSSQPKVHVIWWLKDQHDPVHTFLAVAHGQGLILESHWVTLGQQGIKKTDTIWRYIPKKDK